jgi:hypothetical protein
MLKNYYGEKYAYEFAFLLHYQAWLFIPTIFGIFLFAFQIYKYFYLKEKDPFSD